jgi:Zn-dependent peptidase ImmA (M78 family)
LGHLFLHSRYGEVALEAYHDTEGKYETVEDEAHEFACAFLMPTKSLRRVAKVFKNDSIEVAAFFMVPEPVARQRMIDIGCY